MVTSVSVFLALGLWGCGPRTPIASEPNPAENNPPAIAPTESQVYTLGVLSIDSAVSVNERYRALVDYLEEATGYPFELMSLTQDSQFTQAANRAIDFTSNNPLAAVQVQRLYDTQFLVTHYRPQTGPQFSALIVVDADSDITTLEGLKGKSGACVNFETAAAGCTFQINHLLKRGIDPYRDFASFVENKSQDNIVLGVLNGTLDFGFIRTGQLEKLERKGLINSLDEVRVLEPIADGFFYEHTTALYPEWPIAALPHVDPQVAAQVKEALLNIPPDHPALKAAGVEKFVPAVDYSSLDELIETLKLKTWDTDNTTNSPEP